jgi:hypothetical protein
VHVRSDAVTEEVRSISRFETVRLIIHHEEPLPRTREERPMPIDVVTRAEPRWRESVVVVEIKGCSVASAVPIEGDCQTELAL